MNKTPLKNYLVKNFRLVISCLIVPFYLASCVGTVEDAEEIIQSVAKQDVQLSFDGIATCTAISDKKVEVTFPKAMLKKGKADANEFIYKVYVNGNFDSPVASGAAKNLRIDSQEFFHIEVPNLTLNTLYNFSVRVQEPSTGAQDTNLISCSTRTLSEKLPIFDGVQEVVAAAGVDGQTTIQIKWNTALAAEYLIGGVPQTGFKIVKYNVYQSSVGDSYSNMVLLTTLNDNALSPITSFRSSGLLKGQNYYYLVRAVDETGREDKNIKILGARTKTPQAVFFSGVDRVATVNSTAGYSSLMAYWNLPSGDFNAYRVFAVPETSSFYSSSSIDPNDATYLVGEVTNLGSSSFMVTGLNSNTNYNVFVVACLKEGSSCTTKSGEGKKESGKTTPPLAPFAGITQVSNQTGASGLTNVNLIWSPPAVSAGVCDGIKLFNGQSEMKTCSDPGLGTSEACISNSTISCNSNGLVVSNLEPGKEYCFGAKVFEQSRLQTGDLSLKCITTQFESPIFQKAPTCTAIAGGNKVKIDWDYPNPEGLFNSFLLIAKKDDGIPIVATTWINSAKSIYEGISNENLVPLASRYKFFSRAKTTRTFTVTGLLPNTNYTVMLKTLMNHNGSYYYDRGTTLLNCKTSELTLDFGGWEHVLSVGPRINGLADHRSTTSTETILAGTPQLNSLSDISFAPHGIEKEYLKTVQTVPFFKVDRLGLSEKKSDNGIVQLIWNEFKSSDGKKLSQYLFDEGITLGPQDGYFVYRKTTASFSTPIEYENALNQISGSNSGWQSVNTDGALMPDNTGRVSFTDYLPDGFHPVNSSGSDDFRTKANTGKVVWYTIRFRLDNKLAPFTADVNKDAIIAIIIPPANMASIHHWMANKKNCEVLNKEVDRANAYRCLYGGLGAKEIDNNFYFDMKGHVLVDRWHLGCNFSRNDEEKYCRSYNSDTNRVDITGPNNVSSGNYNSLVELEAKNKNGDCNIKFDTNYSASNAEYLPNAKKGTVLYNSYASSCMVRVGELLTSNNNNKQLAHWKSISGANGLELAEAKVSQSILPRSIANEFLKRIYPTNNNPESLKGIGHIVSSNDSSLPPIVGLSQSQAHYLCQSHDIKVRAGDLSSPPIRKRLLTTNEHITASLPALTISADNLYKLEHNSYAETNGNYDSVSGVPMYYPYTRGVFPTTAATGRYNVYGLCNSLRRSQGTYNNRWTGFIGNVSPRLIPMMVTGSYDLTGGPDDKLNGTELCVSGFGIQDYIGNVDSWLSESVLCRSSSDSNQTVCETTPNANTISDFEFATNRQWPIYRYKATGENFYGQENYSNALGNDYSFALYEEDLTAKNHYGSTPYIRTKIRLGTYGDYPFGAPAAATGLNYHNNYNVYTSQAEGIFRPSWTMNYSLVTGEYLNCSLSSNCHQDEKTILSSLKLSASNAHLKQKFRLYMFPDFVVTPNTFYELGKSTDYVKPRVGISSYLNYVSWESSGYWYDSVFPYYDPITSLRSAVNDFNYTSKLDFRWKKAAGGEVMTYARQGARCAVLIDLGLDGQVQSVDGQLPE